MVDICCLNDDSPGFIHTFKLNYLENMCTFTVVAYSLSNAQIFTSRTVRLEEILPSPDENIPRNYLIGNKTGAEESAGFLVSFDLSQIVSMIDSINKISMYLILGFYFLIF
jgi:hypothetical protein